MNPEGKLPTQRAEDQIEKEGVDLEKEPFLPLPELRDEGIEDYVHEQSAEVGFEGAKDRVLEILKIVQEDDTAVEMINDTLSSLFRYIETIYNMEITVKMLSFRWEGEELKERIERHDKNRKRAHDALISSLISTTRYLNTHFSQKVPETGIYNGDREHLIQKNRVAIADWAIELEHEILLSRNK
jgi:hypothetical protein